MEKISGIYCIKNIVNGKMYVGQSGDIHQRWVTHRSDLNCGRHHNSYLQNAWDKYGEKSFEFYILQECQIDKLDELEEKWIRELRTNVNEENANGYNLDCGGQGIRGYKHTREELDKMHRIQNPKIVLQFDLDFNFVKEWIGGVSHINKELGYTKECILLRCNHTILNKMTPYKGSYWVYKDEYTLDDFSWEGYLGNVRKEECTIICQYDTTFNLVHKWDSHYDLREAGYDTKIILGICNHSGSQKMYKNSIWAFDGYDFSDGYFGNNGTYQKGVHNKIKVGMKKEKDGEILKCFDSMSEACEYVGRPAKDRASMCTSIRKEQRFSGYYWIRL